jgi:hypothetical protein
MRTKTLLLTAALGAAGIASSMAQAVYSVNIVGYVNIAIPQGYSMLANQLKASPDSKVTTVLAAPPEGTTVFKFIPATGGYQINSFLDGAWEGDNLNMTLAPGEGVFIQAPNSFTATFVGEVATGQSSTAFGNGYSVLSSQIPQAGLIQTDLAYTPVEGDTVFQFVPATGGYLINSFLDGAWEGDTGQPNLRVGEPFFLNNPAGNRAWTRNFVVGP